MTPHERREQRIQQIVDNWPPLTQRQLDHISVLLWPRTDSCAPPDSSPQVTRGPMTTGPGRGTRTTTGPTSPTHPTGPAGPNGPTNPSRSSHAAARALKP